MMKKTFLIALSILTLTNSLNAFASTLDDNVIEDLEKFHIVEKSDDLRLNDHITRAEVVKIGFCRHGKLRHRPRWHRSNLFRCTAYSLGCKICTNCMG